MNNKWLKLLHFLSSRVDLVKKGLKDKHPILAFLHLLNILVHEIAIGFLSVPLYIRRTHRLDHKIFNNEGFSFHHYRKRRLSFGVSSLLVFSYLAISLGFSLFSNLSTALATSTSWTQTDWSGGVGIDTGNQYESVSFAYTTTTGQFEAATTTGWYNTAWGYRQKITIDQNQVSSTLSNFPVLITEDNLGADFFNNVIQNTGADILFTDSSGTLLPREIVAFNSSTSQFEAWVRISSLPDDADTDIYMYFGNSDTGDAQTDDTTVWSSTYAAVWHLDEDPTATTDGACGGGIYSTCDSAGNANHATSTGFDASYATSSPFGTGYRFGTSKRLKAFSGSSIDDLGDYSVSFWMNPDSAFSSDNNHTIFEKVCLEGWELLYDNNGNVWDGSSQPSGYDQVLVWDKDNATTDSFFITDNLTVTEDAWQHVVFTWDDNYTGTSGRFFINGVEAAYYPSNVAGAGAHVSDAACDLYIGARGGDDRPFHGGLDELRLATSVVTPQYVETEYNNQNSPSTFYSVSALEYAVTSTAVLTSAIFDTTNAQSWGNLTYTATGNSASTTVKVRTDSSSDMSGATAFGSCTTITSGTDISGNGCVTDGDRYVQYEVTLTTDSITTSSPVFQDISIAYTVPSASSTTSNTGSVAGGAGASTSVSRSVGKDGIPLEAVTIEKIESDENKVLLKYGLRDVESVAISEDITFANAKFIPFAEEMEWTLSEGYGEKNLYVRFKLYNGFYYDVEKTLVFEEGAMNVIPNGDEGDTSTGANSNGGGAYADDFVCPATIGEVHRSYVDATLFFITPECTKRPFLDKYSFDSYNLSLGAVQFVTQAELDQINLDTAGPMTLNPEIELEEGVLAKVSDDSNIYILEDNKWRSFNSQFTLRQLGHSYNSILLIDKSVFGKYVVGETYTEADIGPYLKNLKFQDSHQDVVDLKALLHKQGHFQQYETTPFFSTNLEDALKRFQRKNKLQETGNLDRATRALLNTILNS